MLSIQMRNMRSSSNAKKPRYLSSRRSVTCGLALSRCFTEQARRRTCVRTQSLDTAPEIERIQIARIRAFSPARKFASVRSWTHTLTSANLHAMHNGILEADDRDIALRFVTREYGQTLAADFQADLEQRSDWTMQAPDLLAAMNPVIEHFEQLSVRYALSGSIACSVYGLPRGAQDIDLIADLDSKHVSSLILHLQRDYTLNGQTLQDAIQQRSVFSLLHVSSLMKIDVLLPQARSFDSLVLQRAHQLPLVEGYHPMWIASSEDVVLMRLDWYRNSGASADDQWNDILGLLKVQAPTLNLIYLRQEAGTLNISELLEQALIDAGIDEP